MGITDAEVWLIVVDLFLYHVALVVYYLLFHFGPAGGEQDYRVFLGGRIKVNNRLEYIGLIFGRRI